MKGLYYDQGVQGCDWLPITREGIQPKIQSRDRTIGQMGEPIILKAFSMHQHWFNEHLRR